MLCIPAETDWSCAFGDEQLEEMRADEETLRKMRRSEALAWYSLASLTAYQIGVCPTVIRPCSAGCLSGGTWIQAPVSGALTGALPSMTIGSTFTPHVTGGNWVNSCGCRSSDACSCGPLSEVILPGPVGDIVEVRIDGEVVPPTSYRVDNGNRLVSLAEPWPTCQDMTAGIDEVGSFSVEYYRGAAPNEMTEFAAGLLAAEFYKACSGGKCKLPRGVTNVARNGVSYEVDMNLFEDGFTKITEVDAVIRIYNPHLMKGAPRVLSPDAPSRGRRQTWGAI